MIDIEEYKKILEKQKKEKKITAKTAGEYLGLMERLLVELGTKDDCKSISEAIIGLSANNEQGHKYIAAVKKYERDVLAAPKSLLYGEKLIYLRQHLKQRPIGRNLELKETTYYHKINALKNEKLKIAYRLQYQSGLRISEIADLRKEDIVLNHDGSMTIIVREGKGGHSRVVDVIVDKYIFNKLTAMVTTLDNREKLFYSANYMKKKAVEYGIKTHDLRRLNSKIRYREERKKGEGRRDARRKVQNQLGHVKPRITNAYLGTDWEEE